MDARDAHEVAVLADPDVASRLQHPRLEPRPGVCTTVERDNLLDVLGAEGLDVAVDVDEQPRPVDETELAMLDRRCGRHESRPEDVDQPRREVGVHARRQLRRDRAEEVAHRGVRRFREREEHGRVGLVVEERDLRDPACVVPREPPRVRPEEVVEVAERVRVRRGPSAEEACDDVSVRELDDTHRASVENRAVRAVVQRVSRAAVRVDGEVVGSCGRGLLVLVGARHEDTSETAMRLAAKIARLRIFPDDDGRFDRSLLDVGGEALVVSQFTLLADTRKGNRPSFTDAAEPEVAQPLVERFVDALRAEGVRVETGVFGASMEVELVNDGPVTIVLDG